MREILFRGKDSSGKYKLGFPYLVRCDDVKGWVILAETESREVTELDCDNVLSFGLSEVSPVEEQTLSQFTGVLDMKGNKVFEGDIFESSAGCRYLVFFKYGCFMAKLICDMPDEYNTKLKLCDISHLISDECVVVGNKWNNAELLKGG